MKNILMLILCWPLLLAGQSSLAVDNIPAALKVKTNAVIRLDATTFTRKSLNTGLLERHLIVTLFNERAQDDLVNYVLFYNKLTKIKKLAGNVYDRYGKKLAALEKEDIEDYSADVASPYVTDNRIKVAGFGRVHHDFPYTVEFTSTIQTKNLMFYPELDLNEYEKTGIEKAQLTIVSPKGMGFRYKQFNTIQPGVVAVDDKEITTWLVENVVINEEEMYQAQGIQPKVITAPDEFEVEGYRGHIRNWNDYSKFYYTLNKGHDKLPAKTKQKIKALVQGESDTLKKIEKLYNYLQENTRYMSIQLGIGGWQTRDAVEVATKGYGDCKSLSNYMSAMLREAGIPSIQALVHAGNDFCELTPDFPEINFNHVIVCVPLAKDSLWLECTSQHWPAGYLGSFTGNRKALLVLPNNGLLVNTSSYSRQSNRVSRNTTVQVDSLGNAKASVHALLTGVPAEQFYELARNASNDKQKKQITEKLSSNFELKSFALDEVKGPLPQVNETLLLNIQSLGGRANNYVVLKPNLLAKFPTLPPADAPRKAAAYLEPAAFNFYGSDTVSYTLPANYTVANLPKNVKINSKFGEYAATFSAEKNKLLYTRSISMNGGTYAASDFEAFADFVKQVNKSDLLTVSFKTGN